MTPDALYRFKREFRSLVDVRHENLVRLHELVHEDGQWMLSMELVDGVPFDSALAARPESLRSLFAQLASALRAIHSAGMLHRDIKSSNVLVTDGRVVVLDFGLVRELEDAESTAVAGTPHYMSPEQCAEEPLTPASDWYSFGVMLYRALAGRLPFEGTSREVLAQKERGEPEPIEGELGAMAMQLLERDPGARPDGAELGRIFDTSVDPVAEPPFVGRAHELERLRRAYETAGSGEATCFLVRGPSGVGKSALLERFVSTLDAAVVLSGRCYEQESVQFTFV